VRSRLRERFDVTLPRFDLMAQLDKVPAGMTLSDVSKRMMVSNGNVTGLGRAAGRVRPSRPAHIRHRPPRPGDQADGKPARAEIPQMAAEHESWIAGIFFRICRRRMSRIDAPVGQGQGLGAEVRGTTGVMSLKAKPDYEVEYNNRARVPENPALFAGWARDAAAYRERQAPRVIPYGAGARHRIDFFPAPNDGGIVVFIHGDTGSRWTVLSSVTWPAG